MAQSMNRRIADEFTKVRPRTSTLRTRSASASAASWTARKNAPRLRSGSFDVMLPASARPPSVKATFTFATSGSATALTFSITSP